MGERDKRIKEWKNKRVKEIPPPLGTPFKKGRLKESKRLKE